MKIYIDVVALLNLIYDFLILNTVNIVLKRNVKMKKMFYSSLVGLISLFTLIFPFLNNIFFILLLSIFMIILCFGYKDIIYFKNNIIYFYLVSFILGGSLYVFNLRFNNYYDPISNYEFKLLINILGIFLYLPFILFLYYYSYKNRKDLVNNYYKVKFSLTDHMYDIVGFYDTGNLIKDPYFNKPIILVDKKIVISDINNKSPIIVPCNMVNNNTMIYCYKPNLLIINNKVIDNCLIGLWNNNFYDGISAIISGYIGDRIK